MAVAMARKTKERPGWVKMKRFPSTKSRPSPAIVRSAFSRRSRWTISVEISMAEMKKLAASMMNVAFAPSRATMAPAMRGEAMRIR